MLYVCVTIRYYIDDASNVHELLYWRRWSNNHIHKAVRGGDAPAASKLGGAFHDTFHLGLVYQGDNGVNYKLCVQLCPPRCRVLPCIVH